MRRFFCAIASCLFLPAAAGAATVSYSASGSDSADPLAGILLQLTLPLFDTSIGTLTGATLIYFATGSSSAAGQACDVDVTVDAYEDATFYVSDLSAAASNFLSCEAATDIAGTVTATPIELLFLAGTGTFILDFGASTTAGEGELMTLSAFAEVVYDYTAGGLAPVPLPAGLPLLLAGLGGLGLLARRRSCSS